MGQGGASLKPQVVQEIREQTQFSEKEAKDLYRIFTEETATNGKRSYVMTIHNFLRIFAACYPSVDCEKLANRVFRFYDTNGNGEIDFREFLVGLDAQLTTDEDVMIVNAFTFIDSNQRGQITFEETVDAIQSVYDLKAGFLPLEDIIEPQKFADQIFVRASRRDQGSMNLSTFKHVVSSSQTARALVEAIHHAACRPYWERQSVPAPPSRQRATSVLVRRSSSSRRTMVDIPMRKFTI